MSIGNFVNPVYATVAPGRPDLLFVVERPGQIQVLQNETRLDHPFLDIRDLVLGSPDPGAGGEQGLFSVAFAPDYATSGRFYVDYTNNDGSIEIDAFRRSTADATRADPASRRQVLVIPHPLRQNHNGGQLQFHDGLLYISTGDGGTQNPTGANARDLDSLLGKILRINPKQANGAQYRIPADNPFVGVPGRDEIFAYGLRNPWRFSFDGRRMAIGDVGQSRIEEVDMRFAADAAGANFGWPQYEGNLVFDAAQPGAGAPVFPIFSYDHTGGRCAIVGGYVSHDPQLPTLQNRYLYGDNCTGEVRSFAFSVADQTATKDAPALTVPGLSSFGVGAGGQLYVTQVSFPNNASGTVARLEPAP